MLPNDLITDLARFEQELQELADVLQLDLSAFHADHISLRCHQNTTAESWKAALLKRGRLLSENQINGRPICLFILDNAIPVGPWRMTCVELPWRGKSIIRMKVGACGTRAAWGCGNTASACVSLLV